MDTIKQEVKIEEKEFRNSRGASAVSRVFGSVSRKTKMEARQPRFWGASPREGERCLRKQNRGSCRNLDLHCQ